MGAAKFPEEIVERYIEDSHSGGSGDPPPPPPVIVKPSLKYCPLCFEGYLEDAALDNHIVSRHGKQHVYLTLNGQVVRDVCWLKGPLRSCQVVVLKVPLVELDLSVNGRVESFSVTETTDLAAHLAKETSEGIISIEIRNGMTTRSFTIYRGKQPAFRSERIDQSVVKLMNRLTSGETADLTAFRDTCLRYKLNSVVRPENWTGA